MTARILVAGIGNIFLGDDGFGSEVIRHAAPRLALRRFDGMTVNVADYGIRGMHLAYDLLAEWDALVLVDALPDRGAPGTLHVFEADHETLAPTAGLEAHSMDPAAVFATLATLGGAAPTTIVVGCEVADVDERIGLSDLVSTSVPDAVTAIEDVLSRLGARAMAAREG